MRRRIAVIVGALIVLAAALWLVRGARWGIHLTRVGPMRASNQTSQPLALYGEGFKEGMKLKVDVAGVAPLAVTTIDGQHAYARLPPIELPPERVEQAINLTLVAADGRAAKGQPSLTLINDAAFVDLVALAIAPDGKRLFAASPTNDTVYAIDSASGEVTPLPALDGPWALAIRGEALVAVHRFDERIRVWPLSDLAHPTDTVLSRGVAALAIDRGLYVADPISDSVAGDTGVGAVVRLRTSPNPRALAAGGGRLWIGSMQTGEVATAVSLAERPAPIPLGPGASIVGGGTDKFDAYVMGGKAPRGFAWSEQLKVLFSASIGPNIGPNPERMEVSMNGGVSVYAAGPSPRFVRHLGFGNGVPQALALDDARGLLYVADIGLGRIRIVDANKLVESDDAARGALLSETPVPPTQGFPTFRPLADFGVQGRAGVEVYSGPQALALSPDARTLYVLTRFTAQLAVFDVSKRGVATLVKQLPIVDPLVQRKRRLGEVLYFADLGRSAMSCDACHPEGHTEGVFFEKTSPLRIYRSPTIRGAHDTPPFFIPESTRSLKETAEDVGSRNRFQNPRMTPDEIDALALYAGGITTQPNPFAGPDGAPPPTLDSHGIRGNPRKGIAAFEKAGCVECHPPPLFTTDQDPATRGRFLDVGTPPALALRPEQQDTRNHRFPPPALIGAWDIFPMLTSGAAGFRVAGDHIEASTASPLREVLDLDTQGRHGKAQLLTAEEKEDLLAYLMSL